jgi:hypothetical protein
MDYDVNFSNDAFGVRRADTELRPGNIAGYGHHALFKSTKSLAVPSQPNRQASSYEVL